MVALGLVLIVVGVIAILSALFVSEGRAELLGMDLSALSIFLVGVAAGACVIWGISILKWGTRRSLAARRERKELQQLNAKLDRAGSPRNEEPRDRDRDRGADGA
ncbi:hypothetical protein [Nocardioides solisilvae]|uniref:hypothetical protein n=1 Tax=Nocardioides solisilvae TaxID=1542435 RepID=UPI0013A5621B|nr:hypothetical protein [Nocardioides solisilvae]